MATIRTRSLLLSACLLLLPPALSGQSTNVAPLSTVRDQIVIPELSPSEKQVLVSQAQIFLRDLYVHRYHKPHYYWGQVDPGLEIQKIVADADKLSTAELEYRIARLYNKQRDRHLNYYFPSPHKLYTSFIPLTFARTAGWSNFFEVRVSAVNPDLFAQYAPQQRVPALGDEVVMYNGMPAYLAAYNMFPWAQGANEFGGFARALAAMTYRNHMFREVPKENEVRIVMRAYRPNGPGELYTVKVPWLAQWTTPVRGLRAAPMAPRVKPRIDLAVDPDQEAYLNLLKEQGLEAPSVYPNLPTADPSLTYGKITNLHGTFGYIRLTTFSVGNVQLTIDEVRRLLLGELADTDGLIFDVRNNGGGYIELADKLPQLFSPQNAKVLGFRLLNNDLNYRIFHNTEVGGWYPEFQKVVAEAQGTGATYTRTAQFTPDADANLLGEGYYKPVAVLMNANSYSATDMFTCSMQDNRGALIYGEDLKTGAGGANVITHQWFTDYTLKDVFQPLPTDHAMRVSWRQTIRFGAHDGKLIEDYGARADVDASRAASDLVTGGASQLLRITRNLAQRKAFHKASASAATSGSELFLPRSEQTFSINVTHTPTVLVYVDDLLRDRISVNAGETPTAIHYTYPPDIPNGSLFRLTFVGVDARERTLWNLKRRIVLLGEKIAPGTGGLKLDFATAASLAPLTIINQGTATAETGWRLATPFLQVGYNPTYADGLDTDAILFLDLRGRSAAMLEFGLEYDTEEGWDYLEVHVTNNVTKKIPFSVSGSGAMARYTVDLSEFAGQDNVAVHLRFTSDSNTHAAGVRISDLNIQ